MDAEEIDAVFRRAGCEGTLCVRALGDGSEIACRAEQRVVPASVIKVLIALEAETWFAEGRLDPRQPVTLSAADRTQGPTGISLFADDAVVSWRDLVVLMLTISDNHATDTLLRRVGVGAVNAAAARLGLVGTVVRSTIADMLDAIGRDLGYDGWKDAVARTAAAPAGASARADELLVASPALDPAGGTCTTGADMARLLELIWAGQAGPAAACERVRALMAQQLTRHRIASGFRPPVRVAAKSGGLLGVVRNEIGVITFPDGRQYAAAVFTRSRPGSNDAAINQAIGAAAATAIGALRGEPPPADGTLNRA